jgi:hypothetical protein
MAKTVTEAREAASPTISTTMLMCHGQNKDGFLIDLIEHMVRKPPHRLAANTPFYWWPREWIVGDLRQDTFEFGAEIRSKPLLLTLIEARSCENISSEPRVES